MGRKKDGGWILKQEGRLSIEGDAGRMGLGEGNKCGEELIVFLNLSTKNNY